MNLSTGAAVVAAAAATGLTAMTVAVMAASDPGAAAPTVSSPPHPRPAVTPLVQYARLDQTTPEDLMEAPFPH